LGKKVRTFMSLRFRTRFYLDTASPVWLDITLLVIRGKHLE
jgi:hypothetical protein